MPPRYTVTLRVLDELDKNPYAVFLGNRQRQIAENYKRTTTYKTKTEKFDAARGSSDAFANTTFESRPSGNGSSPRLEGTPAAPAATSPFESRSSGNGNPSRLEGTPAPATTTTFESRPSGNGSSSRLEGTPAAPAATTAATTPFESITLSGDEMEVNGSADGGATRPEGTPTPAATTPFEFIALSGNKIEVNGSADGGAT